MTVEPLNAKSIFLNASEQPAGALRQAYLAEVCGEDADLRREVDELLGHLDQVGTFLESPNLMPTPDAAPTSDAAGTTVGPYRLIRVIGEGGMGVVWLAQQLVHVQRQVALKVIKSGMDAPQVVARFQAELQALAVMNHPNIAKVLDASTVQTPGRPSLGSGRPYFVMELVDGVPITKFCDERRLTPRERLQIFIPVCQAVQHAHQKGIIHRDLKPSNVLIASYDDKPVPKVIDFGVAKAVRPTIGQSTAPTEFGVIVGTVEYMSPEQAGLNELDVDTRSDIYSLGVLLYELLAGAPPLERKEIETVGLMETLRVIREQEPPKPSTKLSRANGLLTLAANRGTQPEKLTGLVRGELDWIVMKCLEKDRDRRYQTASALALDLQRYLDDEPVSAGPPGSAYRVRKFVRRNRGPVLAGGLLVFALLAGLAGTSWGLIRAERARDDADSARANEAGARERETKRAESEAEQRQRADEERLIAEAVQRFLEISLLRQADPRVQAESVRRAGGRFDAEKNPTVKELLDRAAAELTPDKIDARFPNQPRVQAEILQTIGRTYLGVGDYENGIAHLARARDITANAFGANHELTLTTKHNLASAYRAAGQMPNALALFEEVRDVRMADLGPRHPDTLATLNNIAGIYREIGKYKQAIALFEQVRDVRIADLGLKNPDTLTTLHNLAGTYRYARRNADAIVLFEQVQSLRLAEFGPRHPDTLSTEDALAGAYREAGKSADAIALYESVLERRKLELGETHPDTLTTANNLATAYWRDKKFDKSVPLFEETLRFSEAGSGPNHPDTLVTMANLGINYRDSGQKAKGVAVLEEAVERIRKLSPPVPARVEFIPKVLAEIYDGAGQFAKSERLYLELVELAKAKYRPDEPPLTGPLNRLGLNLVRQRKGSKAEAVLRESMRIGDNNASDAWWTFESKILLGGALLLKKEYADAEPLLTSGYQGLKERIEQVPTPSRARIRDALDWLIELADARKDADAAAKWRKERSAYKP